MFPSLVTVTQWLMLYKYALLYPAALIEGPIVTIIAGFLGSIGFLQIGIAYVVVILGDVSGDALWYWAGKKGGKKMIRRFGKYFGLTEEKVKIVEKRFHEHAKKTLLLGKFTHAFAIPIVFTAGLVEINFWEFMTINVLGNSVKSAILMVVGYYFGKAYSQIDVYLNEIIAGIFILGCIFLIIKFFFKKTTTEYFEK